ncbi:biotin transporter BioY [Halanaerobaculum tunisiense]
MNNQLTTQDMVYAAIFAALISVLSYVSVPIPFSPVPVTGQSLAVMLAGTILSTKRAGLSMSVFLLLGAIGLPVFSQGRGGIGVFMGPSGGYLVGYLIGAIVISLLVQNKKSYLRIGLANISGGILVVHLCGIIWLNIITNMGLQEAFMSGSIPFLPGDLLKAALATIISLPIMNRLARRLQ